MKKQFSVCTVTCSWLFIANCLPARLIISILMTGGLPAVCSFSQGAWTANPFDQRVFIENKGQFDEKNGNDSMKVLFGSSRAEVELYFSENGLTYKHDELVPMTEEEIKKEWAVDSSPLAKKEREYEGGKWMKSVSRYLSVEWIGANPNAEITAEEPVSFYYTYGGEEKDVNTTVKANAYRKIIYKNLYPNIDLEYVFPSDSVGIKYSLILHPGANPEVIKIKYENASTISLDANGNVVIKSSFGEFVDHAPKTFYKDSGKPSVSSFSIDNNIISFSLPFFSLFEGVGEGGVIIDPWVTDPATHPSWTGYNAAYDVNYDLNGNVYIYGSRGPFKLAKLNSAGAIQWIFNTTTFSLSGNMFYGDFAVDEVNGTSYLVEAVNALLPTRVLKVNTLGMLTGTFPGTLPGSGNINEMWRAEYNRCINKIVIATGNTGALNQAAMLDTNMVNITPVNVMSGTSPPYDMILLAIDNNSNFSYMAVAYNGYDSTSDNILIKCPIPNLVPLVFSVPDGHKFLEIGSIRYVPNVVGRANGMNGMTVSPGYLYTYDSDSLKRWDKNTGTLVAGIHVSPLPPTYGGWSGGGHIQVFWGGISADECDNIYVGMGTSIKEYNTSLALINTFPLPDTVYDVKLGPNNKLYACGKGFVTQIDVTPNNTTVTVTQTPASGCGPCDGMATVSALSCGGNPAGFVYSWSTSPAQTTQTATGLCPGNYTVTLTTNCFINFTGDVTVTGGSGALSTTVTATPAACNNNDGSATVNITGGTVPYTYIWSPFGGNSAIATGLAAGTYTVIITDASGCAGTQTIAVVSSGSITASQSANICSGSAYTLPGGTVVSTGGAYIDTLTSVSGCDSIITTTLTMDSVFITNQSASICSGSTYTLPGGTVVSTGGAYIDTLASVSGCDSIITTTLTMDSVFITNQSASICSGSTYTLPGGTVVSTGSTYIDTLTSIAGCDSIITTTLTVNPNPIAIAFSNITITQGQTATLTVSGGGTYSWSNGTKGSSITVTPPITTVYCVTVTDTNKCTDTACVTVTIEPIDCSNAGELYLPNAFSPNGDGENDNLQIYYENFKCIKTFKLVIYNRWGEKVFTTNNPSAQWDGVYKGKNENTSVFVYYLKATLISGEEISKKGNISLLR